METAIIPINRSLEEIEDVAEQYLRATLSPATWRSYRTSCLHFAAWCELHNLCALPADGRTVALYIVDIADQYSTATIQNRLAAISAAHIAKGYPGVLSDGNVLRVWQGVRRTKGTAQRQKKALLTEQIVTIAHALPDTIQGKRDRALILVGFTGAFRRGELVALNVEDVAFTKNGLVITLPRSKTDQESAGFVKGLPRSKDAAACPVRALRAWLGAASITEGAIFRPVDIHGHIGTSRLGDRAVALVVKRATTAAGMEGDYSGLSLRAGFATSAAEAGMSELNIMRQTGHKSTQSLLRYVRHINVWRDNPASGLEM